MIVTVALVTSRQLRTRDASLPVRVGVIAFAAAVLLGTALTALTATQIDFDYGIRCDWGGSRGLLAVTYWLALALGGVAFGAITAHRRHHGDVGARHLFAGLAVGTVTLVVLAELIALGLGCYGR
jgi:hypothetical protein